MPDGQADVTRTVMVREVGEADVVPVDIMVGTLAVFTARSFKALGNYADLDRASLAALQLEERL